MVRRARALAALVVALSLGSITDAQAKRKKKGPTQIVPTKKQPKKGRPPKDADTSEGGRRQGVTEISLGAVTGAVSLILVGRGIWELTEMQRLRRECDEFGGSDDLGCQLRNPPLHPGIAAGLSFGFAIPLGVASGLLLARGIRIHKDYKAFRKANPEVALHPWAGPGGGGLTLRGRF